MTPNSDIQASDFAELLSDYAAPIEDDGFTLALMSSIANETAKTDRQRRWVIAGASLLGGALAAAQIPSAIDLVSGLTVSAPTLSPLLVATGLAAALFVLLGLARESGLDLSLS